jgi:hypothetical protein
MQKNIRYFTIFLQKHKTKWQDLCIFVAERGNGWKSREVEGEKGGGVGKQSNHTTTNHTTTNHTTTNHTTTNHTTTNHITIQQPTI